MPGSTRSRSIGSSARSSTRNSATSAGPLHGVEPRHERRPQPPAKPPASVAPPARIVIDSPRRSPTPSRAEAVDMLPGDRQEGRGSMTGRGIIAAPALTSLALSGARAEAGLANLIPNLFGPDGIILAPPAGGAPSHEAHFRVDTQGELTTLNDALKGQLSNFPLSSPASGFTYTFDPALGVFTRSTESFGPIFAERAETIGRNKFSLGFTYSRFACNKLDGRHRRAGSRTLPSPPGPTGATRGRPPFFFEADTITASISAKIDQDLFVFTANYGILDNLDV